MTATAERILIDRPGVHDIPEDLYHSDPVPGGSLSSSGARRLLPPSCPAIFRHEQLNPPGPRRVWEIGTAAHKLVLGTGPELVRIDADEWRTKEIKAEVADVRARGGVPLKPAEYQMVHDMADAIRRHPVASVLLSPERGRPEQTLIWRDDQTGVWCRARLDWLPEPGPGRLIVADYKSCAKADPDSIQKAVNQNGYHQQADWYLNGVRAVGLADDPAFVFIFQEKTPPYPVTMCQLGPTAMYIAEARNRQAIDTFHRCRETGRWPGYSDDIEVINLPAWAENRALEEIS